MNRKDTPVDLLRQLLTYEPATGQLFWKPRGPEHFTDSVRSKDKKWRRWNVRHAGTEAFTALSWGYKTGKLLGHYATAHRVAWALHYGFWPEGHVDHINGARHDNRIENLRVVNARENMRNAAKSKRNTSGVTGVCYDRQYAKWRAHITVDRKRVCLGRFDDFEEARKARKAAEQKHGFSERHGSSGQQRYPRSSDTKRVERKIREEQDFIATLRTL
jgi:hypothetical protein